MAGSVSFGDVVRAGELPFASLSRYAPRSRAPRHRHEAWYVAVVLHGSFVQRSPDERRAVPGELVVLPAGRWHSDEVGRGGAHSLNLHLDEKQAERLPAHAELRFVRLFACGCPGRGNRDRTRRRPPLHGGVGSRAGRGADRSAGRSRRSDRSAANDRAHPRCPRAPLAPAGPRRTGRAPPHAPRASIPAPDRPRNRSLSPPLQPHCALYFPAPGRGAARRAGATARFRRSAAYDARDPAFRRPCSRRLPPGVSAPTLGTFKTECRRGVKPVPMKSRFRAILTAMLCCIAFSVPLRATIQVVPAGLPVDIAVPFQPAPVNAEGRRHILYELHISNFGRQDLTLERVEILDPSGTRIADYSGDALNAVLSRPGAPASEPRSVIGGGRRAVSSWTSRCPLPRRRLAHCDTD